MRLNPDSAKNANGLNMFLFNVYARVIVGFYSVFHAESTFLDSNASADLNLS